MDEGGLNKAVTDAKRAKIILDDELFQNAFRQLEQDYMRAWKATDWKDHEAREKLWLAIQILGKIHGHFTTVLSGGNLAQRQLDDLAERRRRLNFKII